MLNKNVFLPKRSGHYYILPIENFRIMSRKNRNTKNGMIKVYKLPNCRLDLLGILDGKEIKCIKNGESFKVRNNKIVVNGYEISLTNYMD